MDTPNLVVYIIIGVFALIFLIAIIYYFYRWIFSIKRQLWNQKQQINLLVRIAEKLGVDENDDQLQSIKELNNNSDNSKLNL